MYLPSPKVSLLLPKELGRKELDWLKALNFEGGGVKA